MSEESATETVEAGGERAGRLVLGAAFLLLLAAGGLLWARLGPAVFNDYVLTALAWCF